MADYPYLTNADDTQVLMVRPERHADADRRENLHLSQGIPPSLLNPCRQGLRSSSSANGPA